MRQYLSIGASRLAASARAAPHQPYPCQPEQQQRQNAHQAVGKEEFAPVEGVEIGLPLINVGQLVDIWILSKCENGTGLIETLPCRMFFSTTSLSGNRMSPGMSTATMVMARLMHIDSKRNERRMCAGIS